MKTIDRTAFVPLHLSWQIAHSIAIFVESLCLFAYILLLQLLLLHTEMKCTFHAAQCHVMYTKERPPMRPLRDRAMCKVRARAQRKPSSVDAREITTWVFHKSWTPIDCCGHDNYHRILRQPRIFSRMIDPFRNSRTEIVSKQQY